MEKTGRNKTGRNKTGRNKIWAGFALAVCSCLLGGCGSKTASIDENFIGAGIEKENRLVLTITCDASIDHFAAAVEERFPEIRLIQDRYPGTMTGEEHIARVIHEDLGDLVMFKAGRIPQADFSGQLMDLSSQSIPEHYAASALQMDQEGHIYLIPGPLNFNCTIYNKTLFEENGWALPQNYDEFLALSQTIDESGIRGTRYLYDMRPFNFCLRSAVDMLTQVDGQTWHNELVAGEAVSVEPLKVVFEDMDRLMAAGVVREEDLDFGTDKRNEIMPLRRIAMSEGEVSTLRRLNEQGSDEFSFMPHFSMTDKQGWMLNLGYYYGANEKLRQPENKEKLEAAMNILTFLATEEGQNLLIEDNLGIVPATKGAVIPDEPFLENILPQIESGRYVIRPNYVLFTSTLDTELAAYIRGETTSEAILSQLQRILKEGAPAVPAMGRSEADFTVLQTAQLKADALRTALKADMALMGMAEADNYVPIGGTRSKLYQGDIFESDIYRIALQKKEVPLLCSRAELTGAQLMEVLEYGAFSEDEKESGAVNHYHPFAVSGLTLTYDLGAAEGSRVTGVKTADGGKLDLSAVYQVAFLEGALPEDICSVSERTELSMKDVLSGYIESEGQVAPDTKRICFR